MRKEIKNIAACMVIMIMAVINLSMISAYASEKVPFSVEENEDGYILCKNENTGYEILLDDEADLFDVDEEQQLMDCMAPCSDYGFVLLVTTDYNEFQNADAYASDYYRSRIPDEDGVMFLIDMDTRELLFYSEGSLQYVMTRDKANIIGDNIYTYARDGDYYTTAEKGFSQVFDVLEGRRIAAPMKYISNICLAVLLSLIINYFIARAMSQKVKASDQKILDSIINTFSFTNPGVSHTNTTRTYSPRNSSSSGGGRSGGGGGGHSSGGHSF